MFRLSKPAIAADFLLDSGLHAFASYALYYKDNGKQLSHCMQAANALHWNSDKSTLHVTHLQKGCRAIKLHQLSSIKDHDPITVDDGVQPMSNSQDCTVLKSTSDGCLYELICAAVNIAGGLIKHQDLGSAQKSPGHTQQLPLSCAQVSSTFADLGVQSVLHVPNGVRHAGLL